MRSKMSTKDFIRRARAKHGNKYGYFRTKYKGYFDSVYIYCKRCKILFKQTPSNHLSNEGCKKCGHEQQRKSTKDFIDEAQNVHGNLYDYSQTLYVNAKTKVKIICKKCSTTFLQIPRGHVHEQQGCPSCKRSHGETKISNLLSLMDVDFFAEHKFHDLAGVGKRTTLLPFDFYVPSLNLCIEYDGKQHFDKRSKYYSKNLIANDKRKSDYCKRKNIKLLRINYSDFESIKTILDKWVLRRLA